MKLNKSSVGDLTILRYSDLQTLGIGRRTRIWSMVKAGDFPAPIDIGGGRVGWRSSVVREWLDERETAEAYRGT